MKKGDRVSVSDMADDTGTVVYKGKELSVSDLASTGAVVEIRDHPPHVDKKTIDKDANPSPHVLVSLEGPDGDEVEVWFHAGRVTEI